MSFRLALALFWVARLAPLPSIALIMFAVWRGWIDRMDGGLANAIACASVIYTQWFWREADPDAE